MATFPFLGKCISKRIADKRRVYFSTKTVCNNISSTKIHDSSELIGPLRCNDISDICYPTVVHLPSDELTVQQILVAMATSLIQRLGASAPDLCQKIQFSHVTQHR